MAAKIGIDYTSPGPVASAFLQDRSFVSGLMGPVGSGKSSAAVMKLMNFSLQQVPYKGVRYTRWICIRNTYGELISTTIKTFQDWFGPEIAPIKMSDSPITAKMRLNLADKTRADIEWWFMALDRPDDLGKLRSIEPTGVWMNEASEQSRGVFMKSTERVGRYPPKRWIEASWAGVIMDTNPPDDDHWWYDFFEEPDYKEIKETEAKLRLAGILHDDQPYAKVFKQPGGLIRKGGDWVENPLAENIHNLRGGHAYYWQQFPKKPEQWRNVFLSGMYGTIHTGAPVYPEWNDSIHCQKVSVYPNLPLILGFDYGLTPACVIGQISPRGQIRILHELCSEDMGIGQFARDVLKPFLAQNYPKYEIRAVGDPAGVSRSQTEATSCFKLLLDEGIPCIPATTNEFVARREGVAKVLNGLSDGQPTFLLDPSCSILRKGFNGRYYYERVQVGGEDRFKNIPKKNEASHPHDALQYFCLYAKSYGNDTWSQKAVQPRIAMV